MRPLLRRSVSCMLAGILACSWIYVPWAVEAVAGPFPAKPHGVALLAITVLTIAGLIWLYDEVREIIAAGTGALAAPANRLPSAVKPRALIDAKDAPRRIPRQ
jgi:hypothetical protein